SQSSQLLFSLRRRCLRPTQSERLSSHPRALSRPSRHTLTTRLSRAQTHGASMLMDARSDVIPIRVFALRCTMTTTCFTTIDVLARSAVDVVAAAAVGDEHETARRA